MLNWFSEFREFRGGTMSWNGEEREEDSFEGIVLVCVGGGCYR